MNRAARILIGGDVCPVGRNLPLFQSGNAPVLFNDLLPEFEKSDLSIINLECPLIREKTPIKKIGPVLGVPGNCVNGLRDSGISMINLANNHILDHGWEGLENTLRICRENGLATVGAGKDLAAASEVFIRKVEGIRVGIIALAEHEFSIATKSSGGANPLDLISFVRTTKKFRNSLDFMIVLLHGGVEHYPYPSPRLREVCHFLAENGADAVICQHSHCPGCYEDYYGSFLVYGQGNLIFDLENPRPEWNRGFLVVLDVEDPGKAALELIPHVQSSPPPGARLMKGNEKAAFLSAVLERSKELKDEKVLRDRWEEYCWKMKTQYLNGLQGYGRLSGRINNKLGFPRILRSRRSYLNQLNHLRCESHREALLTILERKIRAG